MDGPTERPLSFAADMVRAVQARRKIQTRRPMYPQPDRVSDGRFFRADGREIVCPFGVQGDLLWVRERFSETADGNIFYAADPVKGRSRLTWQQSRYLPREHSRLTLRVLSTRAQRLQEINEADARAEGYDESNESLSPIDWFVRLWDRLTPIGSLRWAANPWLWVVHFELVAAIESTLSAAPVSLFDSPQNAKSKPLKPGARNRRTASIEEKHQIAQFLRTQSTP